MVVKGTELVVPKGHNYPQMPKISKNRLASLFTN